MHKFTHPQEHEEDTDAFPNSQDSPESQNRSRKNTRANDSHINPLISSLINEAQGGYTGSCGVIADKFFHVQIAERLPGAEANVFKDLVERSHKKHFFKASS